MIATMNDATTARVIHNTIVAITKMFEHNSNNVRVITICDPSTCEPVKVNKQVVGYSVGYRILSVDESQFIEPVPKIKNRGPTFNRGKGKGKRSYD